MLEPCKHSCVSKEAQSAKLRTQVATRRAPLRATDPPLARPFASELPSLTRLGSLVREAGMGGMIEVVHRFGPGLLRRKHDRSWSPVIVISRLPSTDFAEAPEPVADVCSLRAIGEMKASTGLGPDHTRELTSTMATHARPRREAIR